MEAPHMLKSIKNKFMPSLLSLALVLTVTSVFAFGFPQMSQAASAIMVTSAADSGPGTLRAAINQANADSPGDTIAFAPNITQITLDSALDVSQEVTVDGGGNVTLLLSSAGYRHIEAAGGPLTLSGMTLTGLGATGTDNGGIYVIGTVTLKSCVISDCYQYSYGAICAYGTATLTDCTITGNASTANGSNIGGGGIYAGGSVIAANCTVSGNTSGGLGGGILAGNNVNLTDCTVADNTAAGDGGGIYTENTTFTATLTGCTVTGNTSGSFGGGIWANSAVKLNNCTVAENTAHSDGGGVYTDDNNGTITMTGCKASGNKAGGYGGGISTHSTATLTSCTVSENTSGSNGGGISSYSTTTITGCTVSGNVSTAAGPYVGGGIYAGGSVIAVNCTASGNTSGSLGGGILAANNANLTNCTVSGNAAAGDGGGIWSDTSVKLLGTIASGNLSNGSKNDISVNGAVYTGDGELQTTGAAPLDADSAYYIAGVPAGGISGLLQTDGSGNPLLADNGGDTQTIMPATGSAMLNAVPSGNYLASAWNTPTDQRGTRRPTGGNGTVGAVEATSAATPAITGPTGLTLVYGETDQSMSVSATVSDDGTLSYQWHSNGTTDSNTGGTAISDGAGNSYSFTPPATAIGMIYYYCEVTNGLDSNASVAVSDAAAVVVGKANTTTTITGVTPDAYDGANTTITAKVDATAPGSGAPAGTVNFYLNAGPAPIGSGTLTLSGGDMIATFTTTAPLAAGNHAITATYGGDDYFNASGTTPGAVYNIAKGTPTVITAPTASSVRGGSLLSESALTGGAASVPGSFAWTNNAQAVYATGAFEVIFTPADSDNYNSITLQVSVAVSSGGSGGSGSPSGGSSAPAGADDASSATVNPTPSPWANPPADVKPSDWFYDDVQYVSENGLMLGTSADPMMFSPNANTSRAMIVTILWRLAGSPADRIPAAAGGGQFTDVMVGAYYYQAVNWAVSNGIVSGYGNDKFGPNDSITREQLATMLYNNAVFENNGPQGAWAISLDFTDAGDISDWAMNGMMFCYMNGIISGYPDGNVQAKGNTTRAEVASIIHRLLELSK